MLIYKNKILFLLLFVFIFLIPLKSSSENEIILYPIQYIIYEDYGNNRYEIEFNGFSRDNFEEVLSFNINELLIEDDLIIRTIPTQEDIELFLSYVKEQKANLEEKNELNEENLNSLLEIKLENAEKVEIIPELEFHVIENSPEERKIILHISANSVILEGEIIHIWSEIIGYDINENLIFQWQYKNISSNEWTDILGENSNTYSFSANEESLNLQYRMLIYFGEKNDRS